MLKHSLFLGLLTTLFSCQAIGQSWNPAPSWKDSYAVDGVCYCDSNGFDHGADQLTYNTPIGTLSIPQICSDIRSALGTGSSNGRIPYNDVQCGNGPANSAGDEDSNACPGRVDIGSAGCQIIGPKWDLEAVYGTGIAAPPVVPPVQTPSPEPVATASLKSDSARLAIDGDPNTRWTTGTPQRMGQYIEIDLGGSRTFNQVTLDSQYKRNEGPSKYSVAVSSNGRDFNEVATGRGNGGTTSIYFPDQSARYVRVTQTGWKRYYWWSVNELTVGMAATTRPSISGSALNRANWVMYGSSNSANASAVTDGIAYTRWSSGLNQSGSEYFEIDLQSTQAFSRIVLDTSTSALDYPRGYVVKVSANGSRWNTIASGSGTYAFTDISFAKRRARYIRIEQTGTTSFYWWSIHELNIYQ